jgi:hypothetical protein
MRYIPPKRWVFFEIQGITSQKIIHLIWNCIWGSLNTEIKILWDVTSSTVICRYQSYGETCSLHLRVTLIRFCALIIVSLWSRKPSFGRRQVEYKGHKPDVGKLRTRNTAWTPQHGNSMRNRWRAITACKYIDVWAHAVRWIRSVDRCLIMALSDRNL